MKRLYAMVILSLSLVRCVTFSSADEPARRKDVERYIEVSHSRESMQLAMEEAKQQLNQMAREQLQKNPEYFPPDFEVQMNKLYDEILNGLIDEMIESMVVAYQKHFTRDEMEALVKFYSGNVGQNIYQKMLDVSQEIQQSSARIQQEFADKALQKIREKIIQMMESQKMNPRRST